MNYVTASLEIFSAIIMLVLVTVYFSINKAARVKNKYLLGVTLSQFFLLLVEAIAIFLIGTNNNFIIKLLYSLNLPILICEMLFFHMYLRSFIEDKIKYYLKNDIVLLIIIGLLTTIVWEYSLVTGLFFDFNGEGDFIIKNNYILLQLPIIFINVYDVIITVIYSKYFSFKSISVWLTYSLVPLVIDVLYLTTGFDLLYPAITIAVVVIYFGVFIDYARRNYINEIELSKKNLELENTKKQVMMSQIQPHFLYNVLSSIMAIKGNPYETKEAIGDFSNYLRKNLDTSNYETIIPFERELTHTKLYIKLEHLRFEDELEVLYDIKATDFKLPVLTLQMIVENAIKHGISQKRGGGTVKISVRKIKKEYVIKVSDNGVGFDINKPLDSSRSHIGLNSVKERLALMVNGSLDITSTVGSGTTCTIRIPVEED